MGQTVMVVDTTASTIAGGDGRRATYPRIDLLPDGRLMAGVARDVASDYFVGGSWEVLVSGDGGSWTPTADPTLPFAWPGSSTRERHDRACRVLPDGTWWTAGVVGWQAWPVGERDRAIAEGRFVTPASPSDGSATIGVGSTTAFVQKSVDGGRSWNRREVELLPSGWTLGLHRDVTMDDGTVVMPVRQRSHDGLRGQFLALRVTPGRPDRIRVHPVPRDLDGVTGSEAAIARTGGPGLVMLMRADESRGGDGHLLISWSDDEGRSWSCPVRSCLWGRPPHLLTLRDGRLLATFGHQRAPRGVMAVISEDGGETWLVEHAALIAGDPDAPEMPRSAAPGYHPMTVQLAGDDVYTCYYRERGATCDARGARWRLPW